MTTSTTPTAYPHPVPPNNPRLAGQPAGPKHRFAECGRFALYPIHHREMDTRHQELGVYWVITDAETPDSGGYASVIRIERTQAAILAKLRALYR